MTEYNPEFDDDHPLNMIATKVTEIRALTGIDLTMEFLGLSKGFVFALYGTELYRTNRQGIFTTQALVFLEGFRAGVIGTTARNIRSLVPGEAH